MALLLLASSLFAVDLFLGLEGGGNVSFPYTNTKWTGVSNSPSGAFSLTIPFEVGFTENISFVTGISFRAKSTLYQKQYTTTISSEEIDNYNKTYYMLEFPLLLRGSFGGEPLKGFVSLGGYLGVSLFRIYSGQMRSASFDENFQQVIADVSSTVPFGEDDSIFSGGLMAEIGAACKVDDAGYLYAAVRYQYALTSLYKKSYEGSVNEFRDTLELAVGFMFSLDKGAI